MGKSKYDLDFKLKLVKEVLVRKKGVSILALEAGIDSELLRRWVRFMNCMVIADWFGKATGGTIWISK